MIPRHNSAERLQTDPSAAIHSPLMSGFNPNPTNAPSKIPANTKSNCLERVTRTRNLFSVSASPTPSSAATSEVVLIQAEQAVNTLKTPKAAKL